MDEFEVFGTCACLISARCDQAHAPWSSEGGSGLMPKTGRLGTASEMDDQRKIYCSAWLRRAMTALSRPVVFTLSHCRMVGFLCFVC